MEETRRRQRDYFRKRTRVSPRAYLLLLVVAFILLYLIFGSLGGRAKGVQGYLKATNRVTAKSNGVAGGFDGLKKNVATVSRTELKEKLLSYAKESQELVKEGKSIKTPEAMKKAHPYFVLSLELRARGLENYRPALFNALKDIDLEVAGAQVASALKDLALSDRAHSLFANEVGKVLKKEGIKAKLSKSRFLREEAPYERMSLIPYLQQLKGIKSLEETHGISVVNISVSPKQTNFLKTRRLAVLPKSPKLTVTVVVENQGNQIEFNLPVVAVLKSSEKVKEQKEEIRVVSIDPGEKKTVTFSKLKPTTDGEIVNLLTVTAGPVPKEKNIENNATEYKFMMSQ